jgi:hypothetical protein
LNNKDYGYNISAVKDIKGAPLKFTINETMMRVDLPTPLKPGQTISFQVEWDFNITDAVATRARSGYEYFAKDGNYIYEIAQWFPRMCVYDDVNGWQHKQFLGQGEFTVPFGDYKVALTMPNDFVVMGTGELKCRSSIVSRATKTFGKSKRRYSSCAYRFTREAEAAEKSKPSGKKTWVFKADNVRDLHLQVLVNLSGMLCK